MILVIGELDAICTCVGGTGRTVFCLRLTCKQCFEQLTSLYWFLERITPVFEESKATAHTVVYSGPARWQHRFKPSYGLLLDEAKASASSPCSVPNILNCWVEHGIMAKLEASSFCKASRKLDTSNQNIFCLCLSISSAYKISRNLRLCVILCIFSLYSKLSNAVREGCETNSLWQNFFFHTILSVWLN